MKVRLRISPWWYVDFRPLALRVNCDRLIESIWRARVARNPKEIARLRNAPAAVPPKHRCGDIDCMTCWDAGVRYADHQQQKRMEDWFHG